MTDSLRIIDANVNRAREALRVMEEYARFVLEDATLSGALKQARHDLAGIVASALGDTPIRRREIVADVGRALTTPTESRRETAADVAVAAGKRLSEAVRVLEEFGKTIDPSLGVRMENLRYAAYELERRLRITTEARRRFQGVGLYVLITSALCRGDWPATAEAALRGGAQCLQLREKELSDAQLLDRAKRLVGLSHEHRALAIINDRADIAAASGADGVHLGQDDVSVAAARRVLGSDAIVGKSTHTESQVSAAIDEGPDYIAVGPMFPTSTKPQDHVAGPQTLALARARTGVPLVAIGGITPENASPVLAAGATCLCVCSSVIGADEPEAACASLGSLIDAAGRASAEDAPPD